MPRRPDSARSPAKSRESTIGESRTTHLSTFTRRGPPRKQVWQAFHRGSPVSAEFDSQERAQRALDSFGLKSQGIWEGDTGKWRAPDSPRSPEQGGAPAVKGVRVKSEPGSGYVRVNLSQNFVEEFKGQWPASGLPDAAIYFEFDKRNGDLVDMGSRRSLDRAEGSGALLALSEDAQKFASIEPGGSQGYR